LVNDTQADLVANLQHLQPTIRALADVGNGLNHAIAYASVFPYGQALVDRGVRGDYMNLFEILDFTIPRLKRTTLLGTRWGEEGATLVPAPGEPYYLNYTMDPMMAPVAPQSGAAPPNVPAAGPVPITPVPPPVGDAATPAAPGTIFAGPYGGGG
jgi:phospholipid/cholesterol/gamma-HCH transport system substrate-binding protein